MANKNDKMVVAYYANEDVAESAAGELKKWDKANAAVKLGAIAIVTLAPKTGKLEAKAVGQRRTKSGALWGTAVGVAAGILTGGLALIPAMLLGSGAGSAVGAMSHEKVGMSDEDREQMTAKLRAGGAALVVMADDFEVAATKAEMVRNGATVETYDMPAETAQALTEAAAAQAEAAAAVDEAVADALPELAPAETAAQAEAAAAVDEAVAAVAEETESAVATEMPALAPEGAAVVAKIVAATNLPSEDAAKLHTAGVEKASDLLGLAATPQGRKELADATGLSNATILAGVKKMDLMRIRGVGIKHGALLLAAGVDTVPELAQRNPKNLHAALANVNAEKQLVVDLPTDAEVAGWVEAAKAAPRIISY